MYVIKICDFIFTRINITTTRYAFQRIKERIKTWASVKTTSADWALLIYDVLEAKIEPPLNLQQYTGKPLSIRGDY